MSLLFSWPLPHHKMDATAPNITPSHSTVPNERKGEGVKGNINLSFLLRREKNLFQKPPED